MTIKRNMEKAMAALLSSDTQIDAASKCGITDRTLRSYLADPDFNAEYQRRKRQLVSDATRQIQASYQSAVRALRGIVESDISSAGEKISAARALLEFGLKFTEINDMANYLRFSYDEDFRRWGYDLNNRPGYGNVDNEVQLLKTFLAERLDWLKTEFDKI